MLTQLWRFRGFIWGSIKREHQLRYRRTQLGFFWTIAHPLALILIYTLVFGGVMRAGMVDESGPFSYAIYLCSGILTWNLLADVLTRLTSVFLDNSNLLKKVQVPKLTFPVITLGSCLLNFAIVMAVFFVFIIAVGRFPGVVVVAMLPVLLIQLALGTGLGMVLASVNVFYRDIQQALAIALQFVFWLTPIVYVSEILSARTVSVLTWNPVWPLMLAYRAIFMQGQEPVWQSLLYPAAVSLILIGAGFLAFARLQHEILDEV